MSPTRLRVVVGEGQAARRGLLRFVLENEGFDVVAEAASTMELAQLLLTHRPDVVVLDDGIDASAVGMIREIVPDAKLVLVWPRGVSAIGADAHLEPSEVMSQLGPTVHRLVPAGPVITAPPTPSAPGQEVIVVPEPDRPAEERETAEGERPEPTDVVVLPEAQVEETPAREPLSLEAPRWSYVAPDLAARGARRRRLLAAAIAIVVAAAVITVGVVVVRQAGRRVEAGPTGSPGTGTPSVTTSPGAPSPSPGVTTEPGTYHGKVALHAKGLIRFSAHGRVRLFLNGRVRLLATGDVRVRGKGVVRTVNDRSVRIRGTGTVRLSTTGRVRMRVQGALAADVDGTMRVAGAGRLRIRRHVEAA